MKIRTITATALMLAWLASPAMAQDGLEVTLEVLDDISDIDGVILSLEDERERDTDVRDDETERDVRRDDEQDERAVDARERDIARDIEQDERDREFDGREEDRDDAVEDRDIERDLREELEEIDRLGTPGPAVDITTDERDFIEAAERDEAV